MSKKQLTCGGRRRDKEEMPAMKVGKKKKLEITFSLVSNFSHFSEAIKH